MINTGPLLALTGSLGILIKAKRSGHLSSVAHAISKMNARGIRLSEKLIQLALKLSGEQIK